MASEVKHPEVKVKLVGEDGNAFAILGRCRRAVAQAGLPSAVWDEFKKEAQSGDYDRLLATCMEYFSCDEEEGC